MVEEGDEKGSKVGVVGLIRGEGGGG